MERIGAADVGKLGFFSGILVRVIYCATKRKVGKVVMPVRVAAHSPRILWGYGQMEQSQMGARQVEAALKELAQIRVATLIGCPFSIDIGSAVGRQHGISGEKLLALPDYQTSPVFTATERLVLEYADGMSRTPVEVSDSLFCKLQEEFTEAQLVELTSAIAWENYRARFDHALGMESEGFSEPGYCALPARSAEAASRQAAG
jgi:AhpD family alkylhydroperoxidase